MPRVVARPVWRHSLVVLLALLLVLAVGPVAHAAPAHPGTVVLRCGTGWQIIPSATMVGGGGLNGVVPIPGTTHLWAVGSMNNAPTTAPGQVALIELWNSAAWSVVPTPSMPGAYLLSVSTDAANDAWAVGSDVNGPNIFFLHWDGTAWSLVPSPIVTHAIPYSVAAVAPNDAWAVGYQVINQVQQPLIEHWNGSTWSVVAGVPLLNGGDLYAVARIPGTTQVVAVGYQGPSGTTPWGTLIEWWNGSQWTLMPSPDGSGPGAFGSSLLQAVRAISPTNIWAAGDFDIWPTPQNDAHQTLIEHWNGTQWSIIPSPNMHKNGTPINTTITGITTVTGTDVWAVGAYSAIGYGTYAMSQHWNGSTWSFAKTPPAVSGTDLAVLEAVAHIPGTGQIWAVGAGPNGPLIEARC